MLMTVTCHVCGPTQNWQYFAVFEGKVFFQCQGCGYRGTFPLPDVLHPHRILYIDQFALSKIANKASKNWEVFGNLLLELTSRQFWVCPIFNSHLSDTSRLRSETAQHHFTVLQRIACGRLLRDRQEIEIAQIVSAFYAFKDKRNNWTTSPSEAFVFFDPTTHILPFSAFSTHDLTSLRTQENNQFLDYARTSYQQLRQNWLKNPVSLYENLQNEHNFLVELHLDMLTLMTIGIASKDSALLKEGMFEIYLKSVGNVIMALIKADRNSPQNLCSIEAFLKSKHFSTVPHIDITNTLFSYLREQAQGLVGKRTNVERQAIKNQGDVDDVRFISVVLPYVSDIMVDSKFADLLSKPRMKRHIQNRNVWTEGKLLDLIDMARRDIQTETYEMHDELFKHLAPIEQNEFVPKEAGEHILYGGTVID